jgi:diguanylate cyclase (GGDEF)-like protein
VSDHADLTAGRDAPEELLEGSWEERGQDLTTRERWFELALSVAFLAAATALLALAPGSPHVTPLALALVLGYALAAQVHVPVGNAVALPTQLFLVPLFGLASPSVVPALAAAGVALALLCDVARGRVPRDRLLYAGGDALHTFGPALVLVAAGSPPLLEAAPWILVAALVAQFVVDALANVARGWLATGVRPEVQLKILAQAWALDVGLAPVAFLALAALDELPLAPLALVPLLALIAATTHERTQRIQRAQERLAALERERQRLRVVLQRVGDATAANLDLDGLLEIVTRAAVEALDGEGGRASIYRGTGRRLSHRATVRSAAGLEALVEEASRGALTFHGPVEAARDRAVALACPVGDPHLPAGVITVLRRGQPFSDEERALLAYLCGQAGIAARNVVRHETLHRQALTDELTGLANHRRFQEVLTAAVEHGETAPIALLLLDLDDFKQVNDTYGHQIGDTVLAEVGRCLREECRGTDEPARYGGEELAVVLRDATLREAAELADRLRREIRALRFEGPAGEELRVTVSVGVASLGGDIATRSDLVAAADGALYAAKAAGKDRVAAARTQTPSPLDRRPPS